VQGAFGTSQSRNAHAPEALDPGEIHVVFSSEENVMMVQDRGYEPLRRLCKVCPAHKLFAIFGFA